jgi:hypothetical protein
MKIIWGREQHKCANFLCGKIIFRGQRYGSGKYCCYDCSMECRYNYVHKNNVVKYNLLKQWKSKHQTLFPHKWLPIVLEIPRETTKELNYKKFLEEQSKTT